MSISIDEVIRQLKNQYPELNLDNPKTKEYLVQKLETEKFLTYCPHPVQRAFHNSTKRIRWFLGGNRSGKTRAGAQEVIWWATGTHPFRTIKPPIYIWAVSLDFPTSRDVVQDVIKHLIGQRYVKRWYEADRILELTNGSTVGFKSVDAGWEKFQGTAKDLIWFDEEPAYDVYQECRMRIVDRKGCMIGTMTPLHGMTWVYDEIYEPWLEGSRDDIECFISSTKQNPHIPQEEVRALEDSYYDEEKEARLLGKFVEFAGLIFKDYKRGVHCVERFAIPKTWTRLRGLDPGINNPTACVWVAISPDNDFYIYDEYYRTDTNIEENARNIKAQTGLDEVSATYIDPSACNRNPAHPELKSIRDEYIRFGIPTIPANNDVMFGINKVKSLFKVNEKTGKPRLYIFKDCQATLRELARYRWDTHRHHAEEKNPKEKPKKVMDHCMDALRYIIAADPSYLGEWADIDIYEESRPTRKFTRYG